MVNKRKRFLRLMTWFSVGLFLMMNLVAFTHAYRLTHFQQGGTTRTKDPAALNMIEKMSVVVTGIDNPRPAHKRLPSEPYQTLVIKTNAITLEAWKVEVPQSKGTVILFHGYAGEKSSLLSRSYEFNRLGYNTVLVDFEGSGGSSGNSTSIGYHEAAEVVACYQYIQQLGEQNILLFGTSMGAAAILKACYDFPNQSSFSPSAIIIECPFGSLYKTVSARFDIMGVPQFPMAAMLAFWGGVQHRYWAFNHNPATYAQAVSCPVLLLFGEQDDRVSMEETTEIYNNLKGTKTLQTYALAGHDVFAETNKENWIRDVSAFVTSDLLKK